MKHFLIFLAAMMLMTVGGYAQKAAAGSAKVEPTKEVRDAFDRLIEGIRQVDSNKVMSVYEKNENNLFFNNNGSVTRGWQTMKENRDSSYTRTKNVSIETTGVRVEMLGANAAYVTCKWKQDQEFDGKLESAAGRMTLVFKRFGKEWKIVHLHTSPENPPANRPVLDSERPKDS